MSATNKGMPPGIPDPLPFLIAERRRLIVDIRQWPKVARTKPAYRRAVDRAADLLDTIHATVPTSTEGQAASLSYLAELHQAGEAIDITRWLRTLSQGAWRSVARPEVCARIHDLRGPITALGGGIAALASASTGAGMAGDVARWFADTLRDQFATVELHALDLAALVTPPAE